MKKEDLTIFEYRVGKEIKYTDLIVSERVHGVFEKHSVRTETAGYVDLSIYRPMDAPADKALPAVFNFHGGGFVLGYYEQDGKYCRRLADKTGCAIINVDYPLAPEFKYPAPILASYEAIAGAKAQAEQLRIDPSHLMVCGHSAGGAIAANMSLLDRERKQVGIRGQIIDYAPLRQSIAPEDRASSDPSKAIGMSRMLQYIHWYFDDLAQMDEPMASPALAELNDLPPMLVISAE